MKAKYYLWQIRKLDRMIENKLEEIEFNKSLAESIIMSNEEERVQASGLKDRMAEIVCKYLALEAEMNDAIDEMIDTRREIISTIELLNTDEYDLLYKMYVGKRDAKRDGTIETIYMTTDEVADFNKKSKRWAASVHGRALVNLQKILDERERQ